MTQTNTLYDLEERTFIFAKRCRNLVKRLPKTTENFEYGKQLIRSSASPAANYIEANEAPSRKDFIYRIKICRKETKETALWLKLCITNDCLELERDRKELLQETTELRKIFSTIVKKSE